MRGIRSRFSDKGPNRSHLLGAPKLRWARALRSLNPSLPLPCGFKMCKINTLPRMVHDYCFFKRFRFLREIQEGKLPQYVMLSNATTNHMRKQAAALNPTAPTCLCFYLTHTNSPSSTNSPSLPEPRDPWRPYTWLWRTRNLRRCRGKLCCLQREYRQGCYGTGLAGTKRCSRVCTKSRMLETL